MIKKLRKYKTVEGITSGRLTVIRELKPKGNRKRRSVLSICVCGNEKEVLLEHITGGKIKSCGCLQKEAIIKTGKNNSKGFKDIAGYIRKSKKYKKWRTECFKRDGYTCQVSGQVGGNLIVHHIIPFHKLIIGLNKNNYEDNEMLWDTRNGITLTRRLHNKFHREYGRKSFSIYDLENFIKDNT